jgi:predicted nucleic acid-binding protein
VNPYADANLLVRYYLQLEGCKEAQKLFEGLRDCVPLPATTLLRLEVANALQRMVFEGRIPGRWHITPEIAAVASEDFAHDMQSALVLRPLALSLEEIEPQFEALVGRHTAKHGFRTYDILHVASALHLGCDTFWSFDEKARKLAKLEGLRLNG